MTAYIVDTETTGTGPADRVCEVAFVPESGGEPTAHLVNPGIPIPPDASAIHHITDDMVAEAASSFAVPGDASALIAHNADFDRQFVPFDGPWYCTYKIALRIYPHLPAHSNQALRYSLGLAPALPSDLAPHRALYDAIVTQALWRRILLDANASSQQLLEWSQQPPLLAWVQWGQHKGRPWRELPRSYLRWVADRDPREDVRFTARYWL